MTVFPVTLYKPLVCLDRGIIVNLIPTRGLLNIILSGLRRLKRKREEKMKKKG
jgi:hypothetical protein